MKSLNLSRRLVVLLACISLACPPSSRLLAAETATAPRTRDIQLDASGRLVGQLVDREGSPVKSAWIGLRQGQEEPRYVQTNNQGEFAFASMRGGVYQLFSEDAGGLYRVWTAQSAPPISQPAAMLVTGDTHRGQNNCPPTRQMGLGAGHYGGAIMNTLNNPWVFGGAVAAGIAIPIVLSNNDDNGS